jgi:ribonuclease HI
MHFDGSLRGGQGGYGFAYDINGISSEPIHVEKSGTSRKEDHTTSTMQEFLGMAKGMQSLHKTVALFCSPKHVHVTIFGDSQNAIDAMKHRCVLKDPALKSLQSQTERMASGFKSVEYAKVSRALNKEAHKLAYAAAARASARRFSLIAARAALRR